VKLEFREALIGFFGPGASSEEGYRIGREAGHAFALRATAFIDDLEAFESDPEHKARLEGEIDWAPVGRALPLTAGALQLFVPRSFGRALTYRLRFQGEGKRFELRGEKRLGRRPGLRQLTTLYSDLFEEGEEEPVYRGILRVPIAEALRFGLEIRVPGKGFLGSLGATSRFLRFAQRQLLASVKARS
jgi:cholesterol oxidase